MDHAAKRWEFPVYARQHVIQRAGIRYVCQFYPHRRAASCQPVYRFLRRGVRLTPAVQYDCPRAAVRQPFCHEATDAAEAAGNQVGSILA